MQENDLTTWIIPNKFTCHLDLILTKSLIYNIYNYLFKKAKLINNYYADNSAWCIMPHLPPSFKKSGETSLIFPRLRGTVICSVTKFANATLKIGIKLHTEKYWGNEKIVALLLICSVNFCLHFFLGGRGVLSDIKSPL